MKYASNRLWRPRGVGREGNRRSYRGAAGEEERAAVYDRIRLTVMVRVMMRVLWINGNDPKASITQHPPGLHGDGAH